jgi:hypothetical protein
MYTLFPPSSPNTEPNREEGRKGRFKFDQKERCISPKKLNLLVWVVLFISLPLITIFDANTLRGHKRLTRKQTHTHAHTRTHTDARPQNMPLLEVPRTTTWTLASVSVLTTFGALGLLYLPSLNGQVHKSKGAVKASALPLGLLEDITVVVRRFAPKNKLMHYLKNAEAAARHIQNEPKPMYMVNLSRNQRLCLHAIGQLERQLARLMETESGQYIDISEDLEQIKTHLEHMMFNAGQVFGLRSRVADSDSPRARRRPRCRPLPSLHKRDARILAPAHRRTSI